MVFDQAAYREEMHDLLHKARDAARQRLGIERVYSVSIWTDPDAAVSAVSVDTRAHSSAQLTALSTWAHEQVAKYAGTAEAEFTECLLNLPDRNVNPADFAYADLATKRHISFPHHWAADTARGCWQFRGPALAGVADEALQLFAALPLDWDAELGVNSAHSWYTARRKFVSRVT
jgi:hypothetical protein